MPTKPIPRILPCPQLKVDKTGSFFTDVKGKVHDLELETTLRPKQASADPRLCGISTSEVSGLIRSKQLYPVLRKNRRVFLIFDCALTDWRARAVRAQTPGAHLFATRSKTAA